jgi:erythromycin esterase-like protein
MPAVTEGSLVHIVAEGAQPLTGDHADFDAVVSLATNARVVLIGEASHGTHEFYRVRAEITKRLIRELGFNGVAAEADWPDAHRINRYVHARGSDADATDALREFVRFPQWMWRNADVLDFVGWLREHNDAVSDDKKAGFFGLDLYSLHSSMAAVLSYLRTVDPDAARRAEQRYACFDHFGPDPQSYGYAAGLGLAPTCEREVMSQLLELQRASAEYARRDGRFDPDALFYAQENARIVRNAERYYRTMFLGGEKSWNLRDTHMTETLVSLLSHLSQSGREAKLVVWAHNSHLGDARATAMGADGQLNVGQLARERYGEKALLVGFTTYAGTVTAARDWDEPAERRTVQPGLRGSYEALFHQTGFNRFYLDLRRDSEVKAGLDEPMLERAIGVIYRPETERQSHYFRASLARQFDAVFHYDHTRAVEPLERNPVWIRGENEMPETYPSTL